MIYLFFILLFVCCSGLTHLYMRHAWRNQWLDKPNERSAHTSLTPRGGGLVFIGLWISSGWLALLFQFWTFSQAAIVLPGALLVASIGFYDDRFNLSASVRALVYLVAAISSVAALGGFNYLVLNATISLPLGMTGMICAVLAIVWSTNLFNFMDGLDGLAATEALFMLGIGGYFLAHSGAKEIALLVWALASCIAGFLVWNKPPAKIFMGDVGSATIGFIVMVLALWGEQRYHLPALLWFILYGVFLVDATFTLLRRLIAREPIYKAHCLHAYQRLHQAGFSHKKVLCIISGINSLLALLAIAGFYYPTYLAHFSAAAFALLVGLYAWVEKIKPMYPRSGSIAKFPRVG